MSAEVDKKLLAIRVATLAVIALMAFMAITYLADSMQEIARLVDAGELPECVKEAFVAMIMTIMTVIVIFEVQRTK